MKNKALIAVACALVMGCANSPQENSSSAQHALLQEGVPMSIRVPAGNVPLLPARYNGVLVYTCSVKNNLYDWEVTETQGVVDFGEWGYGRHEGDAYTWRIKDSLVQGEKVATWAGGERSDAPWELYKIHAATGSTPLAKTTYIQRLATSSGGYPVAPCSKALRNVKTFSPVQAMFMLWTQAKNKG